MEFRRRDHHQRGGASAEDVVAGGEQARARESSSPARRTARCRNARSRRRCCSSAPAWRRDARARRSARRTSDSCVCPNRSAAAICSISAWVEIFTDGTAILSFSDRSFSDFSVRIARDEIERIGRHRGDALDADIALGARPQRDQRGRADRAEMHVAGQQPVIDHARARDLLPVGLHLDAGGLGVLLDQLVALHQHQRQERRRRTAARW